MSFVNLMANDSWSNNDIHNKVQALIRSKYNQQDELKASRLARTANTTQAEQAFVVEVDTWIADCVTQGRNARDDMQLLAQVFVVEKAAQRLKLPVLEPLLDEFGTVVNQAEIDADTAERESAQQTFDSAGIPVRELFDLRNPAPPEISEEPNGN
jgi:hypothetical protein